MWRRTQRRHATQDEAATAGHRDPERQRTHAQNNGTAAAAIDRRAARDNR
jgi:hypothetical protein